jgi:hypothetical protein
VPVQRQISSCENQEDCSRSSKTLSHEQVKLQYRSHLEMTHIHVQDVFHV